MSFLIIGGETDVDAIVEALVGDDDLVRVITEDASHAARLKARGAFVALGSASDADLVERAGQGARTAVLLGGVAVTKELLGALSAARIPRVVYAGRDAAAMERVSSSGLDFVILRRRRSLLGKTRNDSLVDAIVAADDLAGAPRLTIDLSDSSAVAELLNG